MNNSWSFMLEKKLNVKIVGTCEICIIRLIRSKILPPNSR